MRLKTITCSGANEYTSFEPLIRLLSWWPRAELGIQVSGKKAAFSTARYWWIEKLFSVTKEVDFPIHIALHVNSDWVEDFCQGYIHDELRRWLEFYNFKTGTPFIQRVQLNFKIGREKTPDLKKLSSAIKECRQRFIFSYCKENAAFIQKVYETGLKFDLLYDASYGEGILAEKYCPPVFPDILQGYAGGLSPENVEEHLEQINKVVPSGKSFTIDAEGKLKGPDGHFSLEKCEEYLRIASRLTN